jgi:hypothetical protein
MNLNLLLGLVALIAIVWVSFIKWRNLVVLTFIIVIFEGVLRKWVLPQASDFIYFLKDVVLLIAYLKYFLSSEAKYPFKKSVLNIFLLVSIVFCIFQAFNPGLGSPIIGFFGVKAYFFYIPLMWMLPSLFQSEEELYQFLRNYLLLVIPVSLLAIAQFVSPVSSPINVYAGGVAANATVGENVRVTGTFPYIVGYSVYLSFCFSILIPLLIREQAKIWRWLTVIEAFLVAGTSFMTGARSLLLFEVLFLVGYGCILAITNPELATRASKQFFLPIVLFSALIPKLFNQAINAFSQRAATSDSEGFLNRAFSAFAEPEQAMQFKGLDGFGTGATHQATNPLRKALSLPLGETLPPSEGELGRIVLELGPVGFLLWYGLRLILIFSLWRVCMKLKSPFLRQLAFAAFLFHAINITNQLVFNNTLAIYYWFVGGFIFLLPQLEYQQLWSHTYSAQQQHG